VGKNAGSTGTVTIGTGGGGAVLGLTTITGGAGGGQVIFDEIDGVTGSGPYWMLSNLTGNLSVVQNGDGVTILAPLADYGANTYTGETIINAGVLQVSGSASIGSGEVTVNGGELKVIGGGGIANQVTLSGGEYNVQVNAGADLVGMVDATSDFGNGRSTTAQIVDSSICGLTTTLKSSFAASTGALNDEVRQSDVYRLGGTEGEIFVLELSMSSVGEGSILGWLNPAVLEWELCLAGNTGNNASGLQLGYAGSFEAFQLEYGTDLAGYIGAYGVDVGSGDVWAVLNNTGGHSQSYAILGVPEPGSVGLVILGVVAMGGARRSRKQR